MVGSRSVFGLVLFLLMSALGCSEDSMSPESPRYSSLSKFSFAVGDSSIIEVVNFAGSVVVVTGDPGAIRVAAEKRAAREEELDLIETDIVEIQRGVRVASTAPSGIPGFTLDLEITVPPDSRPAIQTGVGNISYVGRAPGESLFSTGGCKYRS